MDFEDAAADAALFARLRSVWSEVDPVPAGLIDRVVAAVAVEDLSREYALLTLIDTEELAAVRGESDTLTLQFSDGSTSILVHVTTAEDGRRRVDGWVDAESLAVEVVQGEREQSAELEDHGRFSLGGVEPGLSRVRLVVRTQHGEIKELETPQFEV